MNFLNIKTTIAIFLLTTAFLFVSDAKILAYGCSDRFNGKRANDYCLCNPRDRGKNSGCGKLDRPCFWKGANCDRNAPYKVCADDNTAVSFCCIIVERMWGFSQSCDCDPARFTETNCPHGCDPSTGECRPPPLPDTIRRGTQNCSFSVRDFHGSDYEGTVSVETPVFEGRSANFTSDIVRTRGSPLSVRFFFEFNDGLDRTQQLASDAGRIAFSYTYAQEGLYRGKILMNIGVDLSQVLAECSIMVRSHCQNHIQDFDEEGVDCGGRKCFPCPATGGGWSRPSINPLDYSIFGELFDHIANFLFWVSVMILMISSLIVGFLMNTGAVPGNIERAKSFILLSIGFFIIMLIIKAIIVVTKSTITFK